MVRYHRVLVPVWTEGAATRALDLACRLVAETRSAVSVVAVIEVPPELPLDAHMREAEAEARRVLAEAQAIADSYGVGSSARALRGRDAGEVLTEEARRARSEVIVIGAARRRRSDPRAPIFGRTVQFVLHAPCRVMIAAEPPSTAP